MAIRKFKYVSHTADIAFVAYGRNFREAFENAAAALLNVMLDIKRIRHTRSKTKTARVKDMARTKEDLVWFVLQDILSKIDEKKLNAYRFKINHIVSKKDGIVAHGCIFYKQAEGDYAQLSVKAVTPHGLSVKQENDRCSISVVIDV